MSKKNKTRKPKYHQSEINKNIKEVREVKQKLGKVHIGILVAMIIAALVFVLPRMS